MIKGVMREMPTVLEYKCPCCGGEIAFDSASQQMKCPYCNTEFEAETLRQFNQAQEGPPAQPTEWEPNAGPWDEEGLQGYLCPSCGGELMGDATTAATRCPYCGNPAVLPNQLSGVYKPDFLIPFQLDKQAAQKAFQDNLKGKHLLPKHFRDQSILGDITGIYVPFWLYDCDAGANIAYRATRVQTWVGGRYQYTRTDHYQVLRAGEASFAGIPADGSQKMDDAYMDALEPFDYNGIKPFEMTYLSGYLADKFDVTADQDRPRLERRVAASMEQALRSTVSGYATVSKERENEWLSYASAHYAMLPVWTLNAKYKDKNYHFAMNGQTGKFVGELPVSRGRMAAWFFGLFGGISALGGVAALLVGVVK